MLVSRIGALSPGVLAVGPGGFEGEERGEKHHLSLVGASGLVLPALAAWLLLTFIPKASSGTPLWLATVLSLTFAIGLQSVFFEMIPLKGLYGEAIFHRNRILWFGLFVLFAFLFVQTQLNPDGDFVRSFSKPNILGLVLFVLAFGAFSLGVWLYFRRRGVD